MEISIVTKGYYKVLVNGTEYSKHTQQQKAVETATNLALSGKTNIKINFPDEITFTSTASVVVDTISPSNPQLINVQINE
jgi:hypothetical protein